MSTLTKKQVHLPDNEIVKILNAYNTIGEFLEIFLDRKMLYEKKFLNELDKALNEVSNGKTKKVTSFTDFIS